LHLICFFSCIVDVSAHLAVLCMNLHVRHTLMSMFVTERLSYSALYFAYSVMYSNILVNLEFCF